MEKLQLPSVTILCVDCVNAQRAIKVLERCKSMCDFGAIKLLTNFPVAYEHKVKIQPLNSLIAYSIFMLTRVHEYIETEHLLVVQRDGWILNPQSFNPEWLDLEYIGPLFVQYDRVGSGGFSLRKNSLMKSIAATMPDWNGSQKQAEEIQAEMGYYEDGVICLSDRVPEVNIASLHEAAKFAAGGNPNPDYYVEYPFGFHGVHQNINHETGFVFPVCKHGGRDCDCRKEHVNFLQQNEV